MTTKNRPPLFAFVFGAQPARPARALRGGADRGPGWACIRRMASSQRRVHRRRDDGGGHG